MALRSPRLYGRGPGAVAFALDCCNREAMSFLATASGVSGEDVRDLMLAAVEHRLRPSIACRAPSGVTAGAGAMAVDPSGPAA